jgi:drug/metabolite transporter (DMT)-like permease
VPDPANPPPEDVSAGNVPDILSEIAPGVVPPAMRPAPEPLDVDVARLVLIGMGVWAVAFFVLLPFRSRLEADGNAFWLWTCVAGFGLGILGYVLASRAQRRP